MGNTSVLSELGSLIWNHPYVSCSLLIFLTPPFLPILKFFSPLLISTALFVVALVTLGPHFEQNHQDEDETFLINASEFSKTTEEEKEEEEGEEKNHVATSEQPPTKPSWADSWVSWVEKKLQNENWKGDSLNDDNVSILQEAFAHRDLLTRSVSAKLATRRIPDEDSGADVVIPALSHSHSWSFDRPVAASSFFSPHPSFSRRHESEMNPLFENVIPPPIDYDMPPLITGPASITAPLLKSLEDDMDMDMSDDDEDQDHSDLEVGESTVDDIADPPPPAANGTHHQSLASPPVTTTSDSSLPPDVTGAPEEGASGPPAAPDHAPDESHVPEAESERSVPEISHSKPEESLQDIPELEDVLPVENEINPAPDTNSTPAAASVPDEAVPTTSADAIPEAPAATSAEAIPEAPAAASAEAIPEAPAAEAIPEAPAATSVVIPAPPAAELQPHIVERSVSLPVHTDTEISHEELPPVDENAAHAISLPAASHVIIPAPNSTDTEHEAVKAEDEVSTKDKLLNIEALSSSMAAAVVSEITTEEEEITHVEEKLAKDRKAFHPDAPQLQITPPSTKVTLSPSPVKSSGASSSRAFVSRYSDSDDDSGDETIDLDSDVEVVGDDSDSDAEVAPPLKLKAPPKPPVDPMRQPPHTLVQA